MKPHASVAVLRLKTLNSCLTKPLPGHYFPARPTLKVAAERSLTKLSAARHTSTPKPIYPSRSQAFSYWLPCRLLAERRSRTWQPKHHPPARLTKEPNRIRVGANVGGFAKNSSQRLQLHSSLSVTASVVAVAITGILLLLSLTTSATGDEVTSGTSSLISDNMAPEALPGHRGNLTADQEEKLRQLWASLLKLSGVEEGKVDKDKIAEAAAATEEKAPATESATPKKKRFGLFGKKHDDSSSGKDDTATDSSGKEESENDKYGQTQVFKDALAKQKPEDIRDGIWSMVKCDHPDGLALRFLRARKWDVEKALVMLISAMNWRVSDMHVDDEVMKRGEAGMLQFEKEGKGGEKKMGEGFMAQARMGKSYLHGTDRQGRPISVVRVRLHKQSDQTEESLEKWTVYIIETTRLALQPPVDTGTIIFDMTDFGLSNMDYASVKFMAKCFEANYPECLGAVLCHNAPWVFQGIWKIIRGWLDPVVVSKIHFTNGRAGLEEFIEPKHIVKELGGDEDWEYQYAEPIDGENDKMKDTETRDRLIAERDGIAKEFEASTLTWIRSPDSDEGKAAKAKRDQLGDKFKDSYWQLDPYVRARSMYDRLGQLQADGKVDWYKKAPSAVDGQSTDKATGQGSTTAEGDKESEVD